MAITTNQKQLNNMNQPIISPYLIYLIDVSGQIKGTIILLSSLILFLLAAIFFVIYVDGTLDKVSKKFKNYSKIISLVCLFLLPVSAFIPGRNALIAMIVSNEITYERLDLCLSNVSSIKEDVKSDIIDILQAIEGENENN